MNWFGVINRDSTQTRKFWIIHQLRSLHCTTYFLLIFFSVSPHPEAPSLVSHNHFSSQLNVVIIALDDCRVHGKTLQSCKDYPCYTYDIFLWEYQRDTSPVRAMMRSLSSHPYPAMACSKKRKSKYIHCCTTHHIGSRHPQICMWYKACQGDGHEIHFFYC